MSLEARKSKTVWMFGHRVTLIPCAEANFALEITTPPGVSGPPHWAMSQAPALYQEMVPFNHPPFKVFAPEKEENAVMINDKMALLDYMLNEGKKGLGIQRYKGLGEMNPDQFWETTMNPEKRTLLRVKIEDALDSDTIFTILMGEEVEPRREFIHSNALEVSMLDI